MLLFSAISIIIINNPIHIDDYDDDDDDITYINFHHIPVSGCVSANGADLNYKWTNRDDRVQQL